MNKNIHVVYSYFIENVDLFDLISGAKKQIRRHEQDVVVSGVLVRGRHYIDGGKKRPWRIWLDEIS